MAAGSVKNIDQARLLGLIREVGKSNPGLAVELQDAAAENPIEAAARANQYLTRLTSSQGVSGYNPFNSRSVVAMRFLGVARIGRKDGDERVPDFNAIQKGLGTLGVV